MQYFWQSQIIRDEPIFFVHHNGEDAPAGVLLLEVDELLAVTDAAGDTVYEQGRDFILQADRRHIILPPDSRIAFKRKEELYPAEGDPVAKRRGDGYLLFAESPLFAQLQVRVTYRHAGWRLPIPPSRIDDLPRTRQRFMDNGTLRLALFGDSISAGSNATGCMNIPPYRPAYAEQVAQAIQDRCGVTVEFANEAVGGMDARWGHDQIQLVIQHAPHLVILAWGMNDASGHRTPQAFSQLIQAQVDAVRASLPDTEFVLVASMTANPQWAHASPDLYPTYRDALAALCLPGVLLPGAGVVLADVTTLWLAMLQRKPFLDMTGNGLNHPNDFGHSLYAQVVCATLGL